MYFIKSDIDQSVYVGSTSDLKRRFDQHNKGKVRSTKSKRPYRLVYYEAYLTLKQVRKREYEIKKSWSKKEEILMRLNMAPSSNGLGH